MGIAKHRKHTNKDFKDNFVDLASNETKKGHLTNQKRGADDNQTIEGILKYIIIDRIDSDGWMVEVGNGSNSFVYACSNPQWSLNIPDSTITDTMYVPRNKTRVEFSIDKKTKIYTIVRIIGGKSSFSNYQDTLKISIDQNLKTNQDVNAEITMTQDNIELNADKIIVNSNDKQIDLVQSQINNANQIQILIGENTILKQKLNDIEEKLNKEE